jgi:hypothetical protein
MVDNISKLVVAASASQLAFAAFLAIAAAGMGYFFFRGAPVWAKLITFVSILGFAFFIAIRVVVPMPAPQPESQPQPKVEPNVPTTSTATVPIDPFNIVKLLSAFPGDQRMVKCLLVATQEQCTKIVDSMAGLVAAPAPPQVQADALKSLQFRRVSPELLRRIEAVPRPNP